VIKTLILARHAKSSWKNPGLPDRDRPLNKRGQRDAPVMGQRLARQGASPDRLVSSPAVRALLTAQAIAIEIGYPPDEIVTDERLYHADVGEWLAVIWDLDDALDCVMCFGHNPGLTEFVNTLAPLHIDNVPTCGIVELQFDVETWARVGHVRPIQTDFDYPKKPQS